ncbi:murein hydrolase transporter LrgB [Moraxella caviae]|uniref:Inner membrane protein yohK n=1 Tax=Moraxella caviae TaxID=34060 RepID=A0A1S9ZXE5_9GAMM|nr:LrgB family protein [Moraxella caviae]OOR88079.1 murein hydrolase transporter LrgB [Moraxella caviae]STZ09978.1 Inner membrane protein yohK [Moraxella caviae]
MKDVQTLTTSPVFLLLLLVAVFHATVWLRGRTGWQLVNPTLVTTVVMIALLLTLGVEWQAFEKASGYITFWLQPAVVCLAVPLYLQWQKIRTQWLPIIVSQVVGSVVGIVSGVWLVQLLGGQPQTAVAIAAKSVTMPIAVEVAEQLGGVVGMTAATVLIAGVVGQVIGIGVLYYARLRRPMAQGLAMGTASHALGTARVMQMGQRFVAYATVGMILNGVLTAFLAPLIVPWLV